MFFFNLVFNLLLLLLVVVVLLLVLLLFVNIINSGFFGMKPLILCLLYI